MIWGFESTPSQTTGLSLMKASKLCQSFFCSGRRSYLSVPIQNTVARSFAGFSFAAARPGLNAPLCSGVNE
jgi:hypothetical protein